MAVDPDEEEKVRAAEMASEELAIRARPYEEEKIRAAERAWDELAVREGLLESDDRPLIDVPAEELEAMARWNPDHDPNVIRYLGGGITLRRLKRRSTAAPLGDRHAELSAWVAEWAAGRLRIKREEDLPREGSASDTRPLRDVPTEELEAMARWNPEDDQNLI
ncbi:MAG: hypothetical protein M0Z47_04105 [Actinomycetota bacterium]|nr:hypothetical protein [Actinomycetota bacterium]